MYTKRFQQLSQKDIANAGGKGAALGELTQANLPIPKGFVILSKAFDNFLDANNLTAKIEAILKTADHKKIKSLYITSKKIRTLIEKASLSKSLHTEILQEFKKLNTTYVAVRSSATAEDGAETSWAGELETYLNITKNDLLSSIKKCWSSLFTPRALVYCFEHTLNQLDISVGVIIQTMVQSKVSGVCFTVHPVTQHIHELVIEAGFGLGEAIVGGLITPDTYIINKTSLAITDITIAHQDFKIIRDSTHNLHKKLTATQGGQQKLSNKHIIQLTKLCIKIEQHYNKPQDIEWALENNIFYITQARPITTL